MYWVPEKRNDKEAAKENNIPFLYYNLVCKDSLGTNLNLIDGYYSDKFDGNIRFDEEIPDGVAINEAVELSKKYGSDNSSSFVNGVLAKIIK